MKTQKNLVSFEDRLLTERDAAAYLSVAPITLRMQRCQGQKSEGLPFVPYIKMGRNVRYSLTDLREVVAAQPRVEG